MPRLTRSAGLLLTSLFSSVLHSLWQHTKDRLFGGSGSDEYGGSSLSDYLKVQLSAATTQLQESMKAHSVYSPLCDGDVGWWCGGVSAQSSSGRLSGGSGFMEESTSPGFFRRVGDSFGHFLGLSEVGPQHRHIDPISSADTTH